MDYLEALEQKLYDDNIFIDEELFSSFLAVSIKWGDNYSIGIQKGLIRTKKHDILQHEYSHIRTNTFYGFSSSLSLRKKKEYKAGYDMIRRLIKPEELKSMLINEWKLYNIAEYYNLEERTIQEAIRIFKAKGVI